MDQQSSPSVIDRRELLRRGAFVGGAGALAWAAPSVTTIGARAFAAGSIFAGSVSWVVVWFYVDATPDKWYRVKYDSTATGYTADPSAGNCDSILNGKGGTGAFGSQAKTYVENANATVGLNRDFVASIPEGVTAIATSNGGFLRLKIAPSAKVEVLSWILHDGSCNDGDDKIRTSVKRGTPPVGPAVPLAPGAEEDFLWVKCT